MNKICFKCNNEKDINEFYKHPQMPDGHLGKCKECTKRDVSERRIVNKEYYYKFDKNRYRNNIFRLLGSRYDGMRRRVLGLCKGKGTLGKELLPENEFIRWCYEKKNYKIFLKLYNNWKKDNYKRNSSPSIDRIDNNKGYSIENLQWLTNRQNCKKHTNSKWFEYCSVKGCKGIHRAKGLCIKHWTREHKKLAKLKF